MSGVFSPRSDASFNESGLDTARSLTSSAKLRNAPLIQEKTLFGVSHSVSNLKRT